MKDNNEVLILFTAKDVAVSREEGITRSGAILCSKRFELYTTLKLTYDFT